MEAVEIRGKLVSVAGLRSCGKALASTEVRTAADCGLLHLRSSGGVGQTTGLPRASVAKHFEQSIEIFKPRILDDDAPAAIFVLDAHFKAK